MNKYNGALIASKELDINTGFFEKSVRYWKEDIVIVPYIVNSAMPGFIIVDSNLFSA